MTHWLTGGEQVFVIVAAIHIRRKDVRVSPRENVRQEWYAKDADSVDSLCLRSDSKAKRHRSGLKQLIEDSDAKLI